MAKAADMTGQVFNSLTVIEQTGVNKSRLAIYKCLCSCGNFMETTGTALRTGHTKSCGCFKIASTKARMTKHGNVTWKGKKPKLYEVWCEIRARCNRVTHKNYDNYGGRGIKVCAEWDDYAKFVEHVSPVQEGMSIDRIDNNGNYEPGNVRWASVTTQSRNRRNVKRLSWGGKTQTAEEWGVQLGIPPQTIRQRVAKGWSVHRCLEQAELPGSKITVGIPV